MSAKTTYKAGDVIDVAWCVSADHGGVPQFRLCDDEGLVSAVTTPGYEPTVADHSLVPQARPRLHEGQIVPAPRRDSSFLYFHSGFF